MSEIKKVERQPGNTVYPSAVALITSVDAQGKPNVAPAAKVFNLSIAHPVLVGVALRASAYTYRLIRESGVFVVNFPTAAMVDQVVDCGTASGAHGVDKFEAYGLTPVPGSHVRAPLIAECPVNVECRVVSQQTLGDHEFVVGEALAEHVSASALDADDEPDTEKVNPLIVLNGGFWRLGERVQSYRGY